MAYGILPTRLSVMLRVAKEGPGRLESEEALRTWDADVVSARAAERTTSTSEAIIWWLETIELWDHLSAEFTVCRPRSVWSELYSKVYVREMELWGAAPPLRSKLEDTIMPGIPPKPPGSWSTTRQEAMHVQSIRHTELDPNTNGPIMFIRTPEPRRPLELRQVQ
jgi:hypothetical protein